MKRTEIINALADLIGAERYLEIGVRDVRENFAHIKVGEKISVDPDKKTKATLKITSDKFFESYGGGLFDLVFVDGLHTSEQSFKDVLNAMNTLTPNGIIVMHDCNPPTAWHVRPYEDYLANRGPWNGDVYKAFIRVRNEIDGIAAFTVDSDYGCGIIVPNPSEHGDRFNEYMNQPPNMHWDDYDYEAFNDHRADVLNLIAPQKFRQLCKTS